MKFATLAVVALFGNVIAQDEDAAEEEDDDMELPEEAIGDCADSSECAEGEFCVFTYTVPEEGADKTWSPSACGAELTAALMLIWIPSLLEMKHPGAWNS